MTDKWLKKLNQGSRLAFRLSFFVMELFMAVGIVMLLLQAPGSTEQLSDRVTVVLSMDLFALFLGPVIFAGALTIRKRAENFLMMLFCLHCSLFLVLLTRLADSPVGLERIWTLQFLLTAVFSFSLALFVRQNISKTSVIGELFGTGGKWERVETVLIALVIGLMLGLAVANTFTGVLTYEDADGTGHRGDLYALFGCLFVVSMGILSVRIMLSDIAKRKKLSLMLTVTIPTVHGLMQFFFGGLEILYPVLLLLLFYNYGEFFADIQSRNMRMKDTLASYLSEAMVKEVMEKKEAFSGKKYRATVLVSDLRGFTATGGHLSTAALVEILNHYFSAMMETISSEGGTVTEFLGDGLLCVFGAPEEAEDHADRALSAAVRMQLSMREINRWNKEHGYPRLQMGIGLHSGDILFGTIGTSRIARLMAIGRTVNDTFRVEDCSLGGQVLISEDVKKTLHTSAVTRAYAALDTEGEALEILEVLSVDGPEPLVLPERKEEMVFLHKPLKVRFRRMSSKQVEAEQINGEIPAFSSGELLLRTENQLQPLDNLRIDGNILIPEPLYGKVMERETDGLFRIAFTYIVEEVGELCDTIRSARKDSGEM